MLHGVGIGAQRVVLLCVCGRVCVCVRAFRCEGVAVWCSQAAPDMPQQSTEQKLSITEQQRGQTQQRTSENQR